jgi:cytochrome c peroxidase
MPRVLVAASLCAAAAVGQTNFPPPPVPTGNPMTQQKVLLGMTLFFEEQLSSSGTVACATCHDLERGGVDPRTPTGVNPGPDGLFGTPDDQHGSPGVTRILANGTLEPTNAHGFAASVTRAVDRGAAGQLGRDGARRPHVERRRDEARGGAAARVREQPAGAAAELHRRADLPAAVPAHLRLRDDRPDPNRQRTARRC